MSLFVDVPNVIGQPTDLRKQCADKLPEIVFTMNSIAYTAL